MNCKPIYQLAITFLLASPLIVLGQAPGVYSPTTKPNYVRVWDATAPETNAGILPTRPLKDVKQTTQYFDGLGRPLQTVLKQGSFITNSSSPASSAGAVDMVSTVVYDQFGREQYKFLPSPANTTGGNISVSDGLFKLNPFVQQSAFYDNGNATNPLKGQGELYFYEQTQFEASPLNRTVKTLAPGNSWVGNAKGVENKYWTNTSIDAVRIWNVDNDQNGLANYSTPSGTAGIYAAGALYKTVTVDEHGKQVIEFQDKAGKIVLKKVQLTASADDGAGKDYTNWVCTYYIYDDLNALRCVVQPRGVELLIENGWNMLALNGDILKEQCFRYEYDYRNRMIIKKVPGAGEVHMVYDARDRLVMTQDARQREQNLWMYTEYDVLNRPFATGFFYGGGDRAYHAEQARNSTSYPPLSQGYALLSHTLYDGYGWLTNYSTPFTANRNTQYDGYFYAPAGSFPYPQALTQSNQTTGLVTGIRIVSPQNWQTYYTINFYDDKGRVIQTQNTNVTGGVDILTTQYSFSGQPLITVLKQQTGSHTIVIVTRMDYDELWRLSSVKKKISSTLVNGGAMPANWTTVLNNEYDALGQLKKKKLAAEYNSGAALETLNNEYNIRGWLLGTNRDYLRDQGSSGYMENYFGFELGYDKCTTTPGTCAAAGNQFNGNIGAQIWKSAGDQVRRRYNYGYDEMSRLNKADFSQNTMVSSGGSWGTSGMDFSVSGFVNDGGKIKYDANGNISSMIQAGFKIGQLAAIIDALHYEYYDYSNKLRRVTDDYNDNNSKLGDFKYDAATKHAQKDYIYDVNGNLITDNNKKIGDLTTGGGITYNHLNLPQQITVKDAQGNQKGTITYIYDATGTKLQKITAETNAIVWYNGSSYTSNITTTTNYIGGAVYESKSYSNSALSALAYTDQLQFVGHEEGRIRFIAAADNKPAKFAYDYFVKDHLGNVRMVLTDEQQEASYFATMELGTGNTIRDKEKKLFSGIDATAFLASGVPGGYPTDNSMGNPNDYVVKVNGSAQKMGPGIVLKVMAGDVIDMGVKSFYRSNVSPGNNTDMLVDILTSLATGIVGTAGEVKGTPSELSNGTTSPLLGALNLFRPANNSTPAGKPKAFLNWILLDEQFKYVGTYPQSGALPVGDAGELTPLVPPSISITKSGYLYIYVSNETQNWDVFFDNLAINHHAGPILEETHYYPFGLTMAGISSRALRTNYAENKHKFNGANEIQNKEFSDGSGLELYDATYRMYDPQIGRFHQMDPLSDFFDGYSPYVFALNNPILMNDPMGLAADTAVPGVPLMPAVIVVPSNPQLNPSEVNSTCITCDVADPSQALPQIPDIEIFVTVEEVEDTKETPIGFINKAPDWLYQTRPWKAFGLDATYHALDFFGVNLLDDYIARRRAGQNSPGRVVSETAQLIASGIGIGRKTPVGRRGNPIKVVSKNTATVISGRKYTGHALDRMQERGIISPTAVDDIIKNPGSIFPGSRPGTHVYVRDGIRVVANAQGDVITVF